MLSRWQMWAYTEKVEKESPQMNLPLLVWRELLERKAQMFTMGFGIVLGITTVIAIHKLTRYSEKAVARELDSLGANVLVLPSLFWGTTSCTLRNWRPDETSVLPMSRRRPPAAVTIMEE